MAKKTTEGTSENPDSGGGNPAYEIGYGKPPVASRFRRGTSGNPLGRPRQPRGKTTFGGAMRELLMSDVTVEVDGRRRPMLRIEALVNALVTGAMAGNVSAARLVLDLAHRFVPSDRPVENMHKVERVEDDPAFRRGPNYTAEFLELMARFPDDYEHEIAAWARSRAKLRDDDDPSA